MACFPVQSELRIWLVDLLRQHNAGFVFFFFKTMHKELKDLFHIATAQSHFSFNGFFMIKLMGVAMGSPPRTSIGQSFYGSS